MSNGNLPSNELESETETQPISTASAPSAPTRNIGKIFRPNLKSPGQEPSSDRQRNIITIVLIITALAIFVGLIAYTFTLKHRKRRDLEEARKRLSKVVITAGSSSSNDVGCDRQSSNLSSSPRAPSNERHSRTRQSDLLKGFRYSGPLVMQADLKGEIKHFLDASLSQSFHGPLQFDPAHNEIVFIGTDVDRIEKSPEPSREEAAAHLHRVKTPGHITWAVKEKVRRCVAYLDECAAQKAKSASPGRNVLNSKERPFSSAPAQSPLSHAVPELSDEKKLSKMPQEKGAKKLNLTKTPMKKTSLAKVSARKASIKSSKPTADLRGAKMRYCKEARKSPKILPTTAVEVIGVPAHDDELQLDRTADDASPDGSVWLVKRKKSPVLCPTQDDEEKSLRETTEKQTENEKQGIPPADENTAKTPTWDVDVKKAIRESSISPTQDEEEKKPLSRRGSGYLNQSGSSNSLTPQIACSIGKDNQNHT